MLTPQLAAPATRAQFRQGARASLGESVGADTDAGCELRVAVPATEAREQTELSGGEPSETRAHAPSHIATAEHRGLVHPGQELGVIETEGSLRSRKLRFRRRRMTPRR